MSAPISSEARSARARFAVLRRHHPDGSPAVDEAHRVLKVQRARDYLNAIMAVPPRLTPAERLELVEILATCEGGDHDAAA